MAPTSNLTVTASTWTAKVNQTLPVLANGGCPYESESGSRRGRRLSGHQTPTQLPGKIMIFFGTNAAAAGSQAPVTVSESSSEPESRLRVGIRAQVSVASLGLVLSGKALFIRLFSAESRGMSGVLVSKSHIMSVIP